MNRPGLYARAIAQISSLSARLDILILLLTLVSVYYALSYARENLKFNSETADLVDQNRPFRHHYDDFLKTFPEYNKTMLVVIDSQGAGQAKDSALALAVKLAEDKKNFHSVYTPFLGPFFDRNAFLYLAPEKLEELLNNLTSAQPALAELSADPSLRGVFGLMNLGVVALENGQALPGRFVDIADMLTNAMKSQAQGKSTAVDWSRQFANNGEKASRLILVQPNFDYSKTVPGIESANAVRQAATDLQLTVENGVDVRLTGEVALTIDEMTEIQNDMQVAGFISLGLVTLLIIFAFRSFRLIVAALGTLLVGLAWSLAYATLAVGELNMISMSFNVLFLGLGIDHCLHLGLAYQQCVGNGMRGRDAIKRMVVHSGPGVTFSGFTSALGFLSFWPTDYRGLADLGLIAGGAMMIAVVASFTVFPAILTLLRTERSPRMQRQFGGIVRRMHGEGTTFDKKVAIIIIALAVPALFFATRLHFDYSTLALKDPSSESYQALHDLEKDGMVTDYAVNVLAKDINDASALAERLKNLETVKEVRTPLSYVPKEQALKLSMLEDARFLLGPALNPPVKKRAPTPAILESESAKILGRIDGLASTAKETDGGRALLRFAAALKTLLKNDDAQAELVLLQERLTADLGKRLEELRLGINARAFEFKDLPKDLREREIADDGRARVVVLPKNDLSEGPALAKFVDEVTSIAPTATGRPVLEAGVGEIVAESFWHALLTAFAAILVILLIIMRNLRDMVFALFPLILAGTLTMGMASLLGISLNFANIIVLPLMLGLGIGEAMHVVLQHRAHQTTDYLLDSTTPTAIIYSMLTTISAFVALSFVGHRGIASMGILLTIALCWSMVTTVIALPFVLKWETRRRARNAAAQRASAKKARKRGR